MSSDSLIQQLTLKAHEDGFLYALDPAVLAALNDRLGAFPSPPRTLETGCGLSTVVFSQHCEHHDCFTLARDERSKYVEGHHQVVLKSITFHLGSTLETLPAFRPDKPLDLVLIDGGHAHPIPELDYLFTRDWLKPDGLLILDNIEIPTINHLFQVLRETPQFAFDGCVSNAAFFRRTNEDFPSGDWHYQPYNVARFPSLDYPMSAGARFSASLGKLRAQTARRFPRLRRLYQSIKGTAKEPSSGS